jgi:hypothetical protein
VRRCSAWAAASWAGAGDQGRAGKKKDGPRSWAEACWATGGGLFSFLFHFPKPFPKRILIANKFSPKQQA